MAVPITPALPLAAGLAGALLAALFAQFALRGVSDRPGWHPIKPGAMHWTGLVLGCGLAALMLYVRLFVGSTRADAAFQMRVLSVLIAAFAFGAGICAWQFRAILRAGLHWRENELARSDASGALAIKSLSRVASVDRSWSGTARVTFADGEVIALDPMARNAADLLARIDAVQNA